jgi:glycyl-tRNA synthetase alpha subunit
VAVIKRVRDLAIRCAEQFLETRRELGFPLLPAQESAS